MRGIAATDMYTFPDLLFFPVMVTARIVFCNRKTQGYYNFTLYQKSGVATSIKLTVIVFIKLKQSG